MINQNLNQSFDHMQQMLDGLEQKSRQGVVVGQDEINVLRETFHQLRDQVTNEPNSDRPMAQTTQAHNPNPATPNRRAS